MILGAPALAQTPNNGLPHPGMAVYTANCAACHDHPDETRAPTKATLSAMSFQAITYALTRGKMQAQGANLTDETRGQLITYLTCRSTATLDTWSQAMMCAADRRPLELAATPTLAPFGVAARHRPPS